MVTKEKYLKTLSGIGLLNALNEFPPNIINEQPYTEKELLECYMSYTDPILIHIRKMGTDNVFVLGNELRALFGHLADYRLNPTNRKNLSDAYGHFRRINLDAFKIICDKLDAFLFEFLKTHYHFDYRKINQSFLSQYVSKYFAAQKAYMKAQVSERTGSDRLSGNIIREYYDAAKYYVELFEYLQNNYAGLEFTKWKSIIKNAVNFAIVGAGIFLSILTK